MQNVGVKTMDEMKMLRGSHRGTVDSEADDTIVDVSLVNVTSEYGIIVNSFLRQVQAENYIGACRKTIRRK